MLIASPSKWRRLRREFSQWAERRTTLASDAKLEPKPRVRLSPAEQKEFDYLVRQYRSVDSLLDWTQGGGGAEHSTAEPLFCEGQMLAGRFKIIRFIGRGGMGEVYEAANTTLHDTRVALKTLSAEVRERPGATRRFMVEVELAQRVTHPNICRIHDIYPYTVSEPGGTEIQGHFLTMHLLEGESLARYIARRGSIGFSEAIPLLRTMANALAAAHDAGVIHRDFKPGNVILIYRRGSLEPVITDFGLAALAGRPADAETGAALAFYTCAGTPEYAAPEQLRDGCASPASDIYSLGVVALEMLTGQTVDLTARTLPPSARQAIVRCVAADPKERFSSAPDFVAALAGEAVTVAERPPFMTRRKAIVTGAVLGAGALTAFVERNRLFPEHLRSLAILPFTLENSNAPMPGFQEELVRTFLKSRKVRLIAPYSALSIQVPSDVRRLQKLIPADGFLTGTISVKVITLRLVSKDGTQIWSKQFSRGETQFALNRLIVAAVVKQIAGAEEAEFTSAPNYVPTEEGYLAYVNAREVMRSHQKRKLLEAEALFHEAILHDASFSLAFSGLAYALFLMNRMEEARSAANRAIQLDPNSAEAHFVKGYLLYRNDWDWPAALAAFKRAVDLEPYNAANHQAYGGALADLGRFALGIPELKTSVEFDPISYNARIALGVESLFARNFNVAQNELETAISLARQQNDYVARPYPFLGAAWLMKGDHEKAFAYYSQALHLEPQTPRIVAHYVFGAARTGHLADARAQMAQLLRLPDQSGVPFYTGLAYAGLGERSKALEFLERAVAAKDQDVVLMKVHIYADSLRSESAFYSLLARMKMS